ncbi:DUF4360 domain-containing protein [Actinomadura macra]|uniref:DUF4360 domain-containing protein n=1 Tax=Actinomadura macra TaxID=46164 RepID=UPI000834C8E1|nr:DUF4360 domain-containing protein [Actinomadura macra]
MTNSRHAASAALGAALALTALTSAPASADPTTPPPGSVTITRLTSSGSGCPPDTVGFSVDLQTYTFTLTPTDFRAHAGGTAEPTDRFRICQTGLQISAPKEFTYAVAAADHSGFADLQPGASGRLSSSYYFQGRSGGLYKHELTGPYWDNWTYSDVFSTGEQQFKPCGEERTLLINLSLRVDIGTSDKAKTTVMEMDSTRGSKIKLAWKRCP